jgi:uncharacterized membrane protein
MDNFHKNWTEAMKDYCTELTGKENLEPTIVALLSVGAVSGVLAGLGFAFWVAWNGVAVLGFLTVKLYRRPRTAVD